ncbi:MAG: hypothetical protein KIH09_16185 [Candidatus Freyarchaeota archaeon]|nr:hypothetical protein [Candidatus Jordarchaeia archaeon]
MKSVGGLGYIFSVIPFLNVVAPVLVGIAWFQMGRKTGQTLFKATGALIIVTFVTAIATLAVFFSVLSLGGLREIGPGINIFSTLIALTIVLAVVGLMGLLTFILELVSHFRAARIYGSKWFSRAAWMRIITIVLAVVLVIASGIVSVLTAPTQQEQPFQLFQATGPMFSGFMRQLSEVTGLMFLSFIPLIIIGFLGPIFSAIAFFKTSPQPRMS